MGDKSQKDKDKAKKQSANVKGQAKAAHDAKQAKPAPTGKGK